MTLLRQGVLLFWLSICAASILRADESNLAQLQCHSPSGRVSLTLRAEGPNVAYEVMGPKAGMSIRGSLGMRLSQEGPLQGDSFSKVLETKWVQSFLWNGVHSQVHIQGKLLSLEYVGGGGKSLFGIEAVVTDQGIALRLNGKSPRPVIPDEQMSFVLSDSSSIWSFDPTIDGYEGVYRRNRLSDLGRGGLLAPPVTIEFPDGGFGAITESQVENFYGSVLRVKEAGALELQPGYKVPADRSFQYFQGASEEKRQALPVALSGEISTPWRVLMLGETLNELVNNDLVAALASPPDPILFPMGAKTAWIRPGRAVWNYLDGGPRTLQGAEDYSQAAAQLGFEYEVLEAEWTRWTEPDLRKLVQESAARGVGIWLWRNRRDLNTEDKRHSFFTYCNRVGAVGVKIDFFDSESQDTIELYRLLLAEAADHHLLVNFHGANKPTGEQRTWPNELTREAVAGKEHDISDLAAHIATLPFTRLLAGPADYTPVLFDKQRNGTTIANQIASAILLTSPLLTYAANPHKLLASPAVELIRSIPSTWDETVVLPPSSIGKLALFARRKGDVWYLAATCAETACDFTLSLSFLPATSYEGLMVSDPQESPDGLSVTRALVHSGEPLHRRLIPGGGFVLRLQIAKGK